MELEEPHLPTCSIGRQHCCGDCEIPWHTPSIHSCSFSPGSSKHLTLGALHLGILVYSCLLYKRLGGGTDHQINIERHAGKIVFIKATHTLH